MTDKEQYKKVFDKVASFGMEPLEVYRLMQKKRKHTYIHKAAAAAAAAALIVCSTGVAYAANVGGIQRTIQLWVHGDQTNAEHNGDLTHDVQNTSSFSQTGPPGNPG